MSTDTVLAFDVGTSSLRTALFDFDGMAVRGSEASRSLDLATDASGKAELDPDQLLDAAVACLNETLATSSNCRVVAVGASSLWHSFVGLDESGKPVTQILTWADARGSSDLAAVRSRLDAVDMHSRTGCMPHASFWPAKLLYLQRAEPALVQKVSRWLSPADYIFSTLAGIDSVAHGMASATGLYNPNTLSWDIEMMSICNVDPDSLGSIDSGAQQPDAALLQSFGFERLVDARWYAAIGDGAASNLGSGGDRDGVAAINLGTSGAVRLLNEGTTVNVPRGLFGYRVDEQRYLAGGAVSNLASLLQWSWRELEIPDGLDALEDALSDRPGPSHGLTVLPFWLNERAPRWRDDLTGCIAGIRQSTTALDMSQAMLEAAWHRLALITDALAESQQLDRIVVSGGLAVSESSMRRLANVLGRPIDVCSVSDASIRGATAYVLSRQGIALPAPAVRWQLHPDADISAQYLADRERHVALEQSLHGLHTG